MIELQKWIAPDIDSTPLPPLFVLTHNGVPADFLDDLLTRTDRVSQMAGVPDMLPDLARAWIALRQQQPLRNIRKTHGTTPPWHPWYGAAQTDPWALSQGLGQMLCEHMHHTLPADIHPAIVIRDLFWDWEDCLGFADFLITAFPGSRLLLVTRNWQLAQAQFAATTGWNPDDAGKAVAAMTGHYHALANRFPKRSLLWTLSETEDAPARAAQLGTFLTRDDSPSKTTEVEDAPSQDI